MKWKGLPTLRTESVQRIDAGEEQACTCTLETI